MSKAGEGQLKRNQKKKFKESLTAWKQRKETRGGLRGFYSTVYVK